MTHESSVPVDSAEFDAERNRQSAREFVRDRCRGVLKGAAVTGTQPRLHLVPPTPRPPRPRRIDVRISATDSRAPYGRSRPFRLTHDDFDELIAAATRMEARASCAR